MDTVVAEQRQIYFRHLGNATRLTSTLDLGLSDSPLGGLTVDDYGSR